MSVARAHARFRARWASRSVSLLIVLGVAAPAGLGAGCFDDRVFIGSDDGGPFPPCDPFSCRVGVCCIDCEGFAFCSPDGSCAPCPPTPCIDVDCGPEEACCPGCRSDICVPAPAGEPVVCPEILCDLCDPLDAVGVGACPTLWGVGWDGAACVELVGCDCAGPDCPFVFGSLEECEGEMDALGCLRRCGGFAPEPCGPEEYCDYPDVDVCGFADGTGICRPRPVGCAPDCVGVCGCDAVTYCNECDAAAVGVDVWPGGPCEPADCRVTGCPMGDCVECCPGAFECIPSGEMCGCV